LYPKLAKKVKGYVKIKWGMLPFAMADRGNLPVSEACKRTSPLPYLGSGTIKAGGLR
jgi:hypothetical protein